jgi:hypothetical protein
VFDKTNSFDVSSTVNLSQALNQPEGSSLLVHDQAGRPYSLVRRDEEKLVAKVARMCYMFWIVGMLVQRAK